MTQQFPADMVGAHRPTLSLTAHALSGEGLIEYSRGTVTIADRAGLPSVACECYARTSGRAGGAASAR